MTTGNGQSHAYYHADANGNDTMLINTQQVAAATYLYDPFGNILSQSGPLADANLYRFSSREHHRDASQLSYKFRSYVSALHRWLNRDPLVDIGSAALLTRQAVISQLGFVRSRGMLFEEAHVYRFVGNNPVTFRDALGMSCFSECMDGEAEDIVDNLGDCLCLVGAAGGAAAGGVLAGCAFTGPGAYLACAGAGLAAVGIGTTGATAICAGAFMAQVGGAVAGCALGCAF